MNALISVIFVVGIAIFAAAILSAPISSMLLIGLSGGLIYFVLNNRFTKSIEAEKAKIVEAHRLEREKIQTCLDLVSNGINEEINVINSNTGKIQGILNKNVENLYTSFSGLNSDVKQQQNMLLDIINKMSASSPHDDKHDAHRQREELSKLRYFANEMLGTMDYFVSQVLETSQDSMTMVHRTDDMLKSMADVEKLLSDVRTIADQTNLLALNAAIEAARAGDSGRGFAVVADEVRKLSQDSNDFSNQISQVVENVTKEVDQAKNIAARLASRDMTKAIHSRSRIDEMLNDIGEMEGYLSDQINRVSETAESIQQNVNLAVVSLQFEDLLTQSVSEAEAKLGRLREISDKVIKPLSKCSGSDTNQVLQRIDHVFEKLRDSQARNNNGESGGQSDVDLF